MLTILLILSFSMQVKPTQPVKPVKPAPSTFVYPEKFALGSSTSCTDPIPTPAQPNCVSHVRRVQSVDGYVYCLMIAARPRCTYSSKGTVGVKK